MLNIKKSARAKHEKYGDCANDDCRRKSAPHDVANIPHAGTLLPHNTHSPHPSQVCWYVISLFARRNKIIHREVRNRWYRLCRKLIMDCMWAGNYELI